MSSSSPGATLGERTPGYWGYGPTDPQGATSEKARWDGILPGCVRGGGGRLASISVPLRTAGRVGARRSPDDARNPIGPPATGCRVTKLGAVLGTKGIVVVLALLVAVGAGVAAGVTGSSTPHAARTMSVATTSLPTAIPKDRYSASLRATGGREPYHWSLYSGHLPAGITLSPSGQLTGTPPAAETSSFTVEATDSSRPALTAKRGLMLASVVPTTDVQPHLTVRPNYLPRILLGQHFSVTFTTTGGKAPYHWSLLYGDLPPGITLTPTGVLSGTVSAAVTDTFTLRVTDSSKSPLEADRNYTISNSLVVSPTRLPKLTVATPYDVALTATGGTAPYTWKVESGTLPPGLSLSPSGTISGVVTSVVKSTFTVRVTDSSGPALTTDRKYTLAVSTPRGAGRGHATGGRGGAVTHLVINPPWLHRPPVGAPYSATFSVVGGTAPYRWSLDSGNLPAGLSLSSSGLLSGTVNTPGTYTFTVRVADSSRPLRTVTQKYTVGTLLNISPVNIPTASIVGKYEVTLSASDGAAPYTWSVSAGTLPPGMTLSPSGVLSGSPTTSGASYSFTVKVTDSSNPALIGYRDYVLSVGS